MESVQPAPGYLPVMAPVPVGVCASKGGGSASDAPPLVDASGLIGGSTSLVDVRPTMWQGVQNLIEGAASKDGGSRSKGINGSSSTESMVNFTGTWRNTEIQGDADKFMKEIGIGYAVGPLSVPSCPLSDARALSLRSGLRLMR